MAQLALYGILFLGGLVALGLPWIGVVIGYGFAILGPQFIWHWAFVGVRHFFLIALPTGVGIVGAVLRGRTDMRYLKTKLNALFLLWWGLTVLSYFTGPYVDVASPYHFQDPAQQLATINKTFLFYFFAVATIDSDKKCRVLAWVLPVSAAYLIYWANARYLDGSYWGRLAGPRAPSGGAIYGDENVFAMLFVVAGPFLFYLGFAVKSRVIRYGMWLLIPFGWHAVFLTGSRGGLVGLIATLLLAVVRAKRRGLMILAIPVFVVAFVWQGGDIMKGRAETITEQTGEERNPRLEIWPVVLRIIADYPLTGTGVSSLSVPFPQYTSRTPQVAHNVVLQVSGESGVAAGVAWVMVVWLALRAMGRRTASGLVGNEESYDARFRAQLREAVFVSLMGFVVSAMFLSLQWFEIFFFLCALANYVDTRNRELAGVCERDAGSVI